MRPGLVFVGLFALLIGIYAVLADTLGTLPTFLLQAVIVVVILTGAIWLRSRTAKQAERIRQEAEAEQGDTGPMDNSASGRD
ncbi:MAG: hypothetical protein WD533_07045 [Dehalococcoidia bacterium]